MTTITNNLTRIHTLIAEYEQKYGREKGSVKLLAVSKNQSLEKIKEAFQAGQMVFGENYLQEALEKMASLAAQPIEWHFIGPIQSNKTHKIAEHFSWVQSINSIKIAKRLNDQRPSHLPPLNVCIEVNVSHEKTKTGTEKDSVQSLAAYCLTLPRLKLRGLMAIPADYDHFTDQRKEFHKLYTLWHSLREQGMALDILSMGMSHDFEAAIAEGSTMVRIGSAIFGPREKEK